MQTAPPEPAVAEILGFLSRGYPRTAAERATAFLAEQPEHPEVQRLYGVALFRLQESEAAIAALTRAVALAPESPMASWGLAEALQAAGRSNEAEAALLRLLDVTAEEPVALLFLARLRAAADDRETAYDYARRALAADPQVDGGRRVLAVLAYNRGSLAEAADLLLPDRAGGQERDADSSCLLARALYALGRSRHLAKLPPAQAAAQRYNEAVLQALAAWRENRVEAVAPALDAAAAETGLSAEDPLVGVSTTTADLLRRLVAYRDGHGDLYRGEVSALIVAIGDSHCLSAGHLVVPWRGAQALILPEPLLEAAPSTLLSARPKPLQTAFRLALDRMPKGALPAIFLGELDLRLTQGLFARLHSESDSVLLERMRDLASDLAEFVAAEGRARGLTPILVSPPASNAPLTLVPDARRGRFLAAHKRFVATLREAAERLGLPLLDLRAVTQSGERVDARRYIDTNHLWPDAYVEAFARHQDLPEQTPS